MSLTRIGSIGINTGIAFAGVTTIVTLNTANDALSIGATVNVGSGITLGASGDIFATGVSTVTTLKVGSGVTVSSDGDVFFTGIATGNGSGLTALNATQLTSGTVPTARLGSGTASSSTFLRGDSTFAAVTSTTINNNADNRIITGSGTANTLNAESEFTFDGSNILCRAGEGGNASLNLIADEGDDNGDGWKIQSEQDENDLTFKSNISGSYVDKLKLKSSGQLEVQGNLAVSGTITPTGDVSIADKIIHTGDTDTAIRFITANTIVAETGGTERIRIDSDGKVLIGASSGINSFSDTFQIFQPDATAAITLKRASNNAYAPYINFIKSRGSTAGDATVLQSGDIMAYIRFSGTDGTDTTESATIQAVVDGTPGNNDMPGRLVFSTTADGSNASTERMRINSSGQVLIGADTQGSADGYTNNFMVAETSGSAGMSIQSYNASSSYSTIALGDRTTHNRGYIEQRCGDNNQMTIGLNGNGSFRFIGKNSSGNMVERVRITYDGITFNGDTAAANALDDYEEGSWTPTFLGQLTPQSYSNQVGEYTKIGSVVIANCYLRLAGDPGSYASNVQIGGLPFVGMNVAGTSTAGCGVLAYQTNFISATDGRGNFTAMVNPNQSVLRLYTPDGTYFLWSEVNDRTQQVRFTITYRTHQ